MAMHACEIGPTDTALPCPGSPQWACTVTRGEHFGAGNLFCPHFSSATQVCGRCDYTLPSFWDLRISGPDGELAAGCLRSRLPWIVFCFHCWVADGKNGRDGEVRHWMLGGGGAVSILRRIVRATKAATWSQPSVLFSIIGTSNIIYIVLHRFIIIDLKLIIAYFSIICINYHYLLNNDFSSLIFWHLTKLQMCFSQYYVFFMFKLCSTVISEVLEPGSWKRSHWIGIYLFFAPLVLTLY